VLISPFAKFALTLEPVAQGVDNAAQNAGLPAPNGLQRRLTRTGLAASTLVLASKVPFFGIFMSILGSFLTLTVSVLFPCAANLKMFWHEMSQQEKALNFGILGIGAVATVAGTASALQSLAAPSALNGAGMILAQHQDSVFKVLVCNSVCMAQ
jgi:solute carrier family 32 (vesicular inhibitory amino acid transporter)